MDHLPELKTVVRSLTFLPAPAVRARGRARRRRHLMVLVTAGAVLTTGVSAALLRARRADAGLAPRRPGSDDPHREPAR